MLPGWGAFHSHKSTTFSASSHASQCPLSLCVCVCVCDVLVLYGLYTYMMHGMARPVPPALSPPRHGSLNLSTLVSFNIPVLNPNVHTHTHITCAGTTFAAAHAGAIKTMTNTIFSSRESSRCRYSRTLPRPLLTKIDFSVSDTPT